MNEPEIIPGNWKKTLDSKKEPHTWKEIVLQNIDYLESKSQNMQRSQIDPCKELNLSVDGKMVSNNKENMDEKEREERSTERYYSMFGYRLNNICNVFRETGFIQKVLPTRFTQQDNGAISMDPWSDKTDKGKAHKALYIKDISLHMYLDNCKYKAFKSSSLKNKRMNSDLLDGINRVFLLLYSRKLIDDDGSTKCLSTYRKSTWLLSHWT